MKIVFFSNTEYIYGANKSLIDLVDFLKTKEVVPLIICQNSGDFSNYLHAHQQPYKVIFYELNQHENTFLSKIKTPFRFIRRLLPLKNIYKVVKEFDPDIIYSNSSNISVGFFLSKLSNKKHVWHLRESLNKQYNLSYDFGNYVHQFFIKNSDTIIVNSEFISDDFKYIEKERKNVIYNGVFYNKEFPTCTKKKKPFDLNEKFLFATTSIITPDKDQKQAVVAFNEFLKVNENAELIIAGDGAVKYINELKSLVNRLKIEDKVFFIGYQADLSELYSKIHVLLVCSKFEAMGRVTAEAMAYGVPVIGHNSGGTAEILNSMVDGYLFNSGKELIEYMVKINEDKNVYEVMSGNAKRKAAQLFTIEKYGESIWKLLKQTNSKN